MTDDESREKHDNVWKLEITHPDGSVDCSFAIRGRNNMSFDVWVELVARDSEGRTLLHSGYVEDEGRGPVDPGSQWPGQARCRTARPFYRL